MILSEKIKFLRESNNLSQDELAEAICVSRQTIFKWEKASIPQTEKIIELARLFKININELIDDEANPSLQQNECQLNNYKAKYFETNGYRGEANLELNSDIAYKIGRFLGWYYTNPKYSGQKIGQKPKIVIGKDTRRSSYMFEYAIASGAASSGSDVYMMHVTTTPSIGFVVRKESFNCGVMITASHNPSYDNGIKLVSRDGELIDNELLFLLEAYLDNDLNKLGIDGTDLPFAKKTEIGTINDFEVGRDKYIDYLIALSKYSFKNLRIGLDTSNGSSYRIARIVFDSLGAQTFIINDKPDGTNINYKSGSTHIDTLINIVKEQNLDVGFAFDGDADRCIAVDETGGVVDGDKILYLLANKFKKEKALNKNTVIVTEMSNTGLIKALDNIGIKTIVADVGDRYVLEKMIRGNYSLGGEQSGHILIRKYASISDGLLAAILIVEEMLNNKTTLSKLVSHVSLLPQEIKNIQTSDVKAMHNLILSSNRFKRIVRNSKNSRIVVRESKTENFIRVMVESTSMNECNEIINSITEIAKNKEFSV